ncbi:zinc ribbon domain-containing protein [Halorubrum sp. Boch-26]|uniref:zinc ribbon domain-containing protein n=1 Tax=Halorubrum sp. Boch-26 TaxID=2994426 RepID=UPI0024688D44|nr:zinc ribbon domain-containing protein [Halorubrum sp. Boch-26]
MSDTNEDPTPPDDLPQKLIQRVDALELPELKSLLSYIERRIESLRSPIEAEIEADAAGEVLEIETHGAYALVRQHPPDPDGPGVNTDITSLYHVRREPQYDGTESLHWAYLGDLHNVAEARCESCGRTFDRGVDVCPNCGSDDVDTETEE